MARYTVLNEIRTLDPLKDHLRIVYLSTCFEFPFDTTRALEFALYRTYCVPSVSGLLDKTGEFAARPQKRYDATDIIVSEMMEWGYDSERGKRALRRMNQLHGRFDISNGDFLYVLSTFILEPIRWNARYGWRLMCEQEKLGMFHFWCEVGRRMNIKDIPSEYDVLDKFNVEYERANFRYSDTNHRIGAATRDLFLSWFPRFMHPIGRPAIYALMDDALIEAFGFPRPSRFMRWLVARTLKLRGWLSGLLPARKKPRLRTEMGHPSYPQGYVIEEVGPKTV
jgi:ER-bound oxygenase mpaB/B'/Rubber oxygenase, catalytic domain